MLISSYVAHLTLAGYRPRTIGARRTCLRALSRHLAPTPVQDATRHQLQAFLARPLKPESRRAYRGHVVGFYAWCLDEGLVEQDPAAKLPTIHVPRAMPRPVCEQDLHVALARADLRMRAWLLLMLLAGLRCCEVAALRPEDVTASGDLTLLFLRECKGGGQATVPAHPEVLAALASLPQVEGRWWTCTAGHVSREVSVYLASVGVPATAHMFRHSAATAWFRASEHDLLTTSRLLRHQSVRSSQVYAALDPRRPSEVVHLVRLPQPA